MSDWDGSLKSILPEVSKALGLPPYALYEHQRLLVRDGVFKVLGGKGPGSGVRATPEALAILVATFIARLSPIEIAAIDQSARKFSATPARKAA